MLEQLHDVFGFAERRGGASGHAIKQGELKLTDEFKVSENAWRKGGAPAGGSTM